MMDADPQGKDYIEEQKTPKRKRKMKTPYQLEILEKTYLFEPYPSETIRSELSGKLNLTDRQLQMWFCHRRLKEKKDEVVKPVQVTGQVRKRELFDNFNLDLLAAVDRRSDHGSESGLQLGPVFNSGPDNSTSPYEDEVSIPKRYYKTPKSVMAWKVIAYVELQLGEPLKKDGPILGIEFDDPPPGAFGVPIDMEDEQGCSRKVSDHKSFKLADIDLNEVWKDPDEDDSERIGMERNYIDHPGANSSLNLHEDYRHSDQRNHEHCSPPSRGNYHIARNGTSKDAQMMGVVSSTHPHEAHITSSEDGSSMVKNHKTNEAKTKSQEICEKQIKKEHKKKDYMRRIREESMRKEMEKQERERQKEVEKTDQEKQRQEERIRREEKRESEKREKVLQKELLKANKKKQKEELRVEKKLAKQRVAVEKATACRNAKESMELIEDEQLELMELAALNKGLRTITSLDHDTLQNLELFREFLIQFPPESVQLKKPFSITPWIDSDENIGNLLMVWRFCMKFADAVGIRPFTIDELVQAFHEYDSRLLGEIHISLVKLVIKDIENISTSSVSVGANQFTATNPDGGHPRVVDGAFEWGFDIHNWKKHLGPISWPEILRQVALSAGFGPKLKKKGVVGKKSLPDKEAKGCEDVVSSLRNGMAAERAVAQMQGKGFSSRKKARPQLTPGTLKFAAYSVLSLEGSDGLTVPKLAQKVQECGLRDLSTIKTPEASISVALSRDTVLFQKTAPSTFRVRPPFRKDPVDAESILSAAREEINRYENGVSTENAVNIEKDDSEGEGKEIPEVEDVGTPGNLMSEALEVPVNVFPENPEQSFTEIDESKWGEPWVIGLTEGEYADLPVQERLNALVALVGIVNEGNSIRAVIEDRFDNANTLKKQMCAMAQPDKKRIKDRNEMKQKNMNNIPQDGSVLNSFQFICHYLQRHSTERAKLELQLYINHKAEDTYEYRAMPLGQDRRRNRYWKFGASASERDPDSGRIFVESPTGQWRVFDSEEALDALLKSLDTRGIRESHLDIMLRDIEKSFRKNVKNNSIHALKLSSKNEKGILTKADVDATPVYSVGDSDGPQSMVSGSTSNSASDELSTGFKIHLGRNETERNFSLDVYQGFKLWMWSECFNTVSLCAMKSVEKRSTRPVLEICGFCLDIFTASDELRLCPSCDRPFDVSLNHFEREFNREVFNASEFSQPSRIILLKALLTYIELSLPSEALLPSWTAVKRTAWGNQLSASSSVEGLLQALTELESVIHHDYLCKAYTKTEALLASSSLSGYSNQKFSLVDSGSLVQLPWLPQTTAAISMRLLDLDQSLCYTSDLNGFNSNRKKRGAGVWKMKRGKRLNVSKGSKRKAAKGGAVKSGHKRGRPAIERTGTGLGALGNKRPREDNSTLEDEPNDYSSMEAVNTQMINTIRYLSEDEEDSPEVSKDDDSSDPDYEFEGYDGSD